MIFNYYDHFYGLLIRRPLSFIEKISIIIEIFHRNGR